MKITGPRGTLEKAFKHVQADIRMIGKKKIRVEVFWGNRRHIACIRTICSIISNMIVGVTKGYEYKMKLASAHFPINVVTTRGDTVVEIRNFLGEKFDRKVQMLDGVTATYNTEAKEIVITGNDLQLVSQSAANIHQSTLVKNKDIRKFLDGIYVSERNIIEVE